MNRNATLASALAIALAGCTTLTDLPTQTVGETTLRFANGLPAGTARLMNDGSTVSLAIAVAAMAPGEHGFHLHTTGRCTPTDFTSAGGHLNPGGNTHGKLSPGGSHLGDLPNLVVSASRTGSAEIVIPGNPETVMRAIFDDDGTALVVHAGPDDYRTDPAGDAGARIACGVLEPVGG